MVNIIDLSAHFLILIQFQRHAFVWIVRFQQNVVVNSSLTLVNGHYVDLARIRLIPKRREDLQFPEPQRKVEPVGVIVDIVSAHLDDLDLDERISHLPGFFPCLLEEAPANALPVAFPGHAHDRHFNGMPPGFFQIEESHRPFGVKCAEERLSPAACNVFLPGLGDAEPVRERLQYGPCNISFLRVAVNLFY